MELAKRVFGGKGLSICIVLCTVSGFFFSESI